MDLVLEHCCSDAFLRQQAENQRRLRELTRRKEAEEEWESERRGRNQNDVRWLVDSMLNLKIGELSAFANYLVFRPSVFLSILSSFFFSSFS